MRMILALLFLSLCLPACSREASPEAVAGAFYELCEAAPQDGHSLIQEEVYHLLSGASKAELDQCAARLQELTGEGETFPASQCLVFHAYQGKRKDWAVEREVDGEQRVRLAVTSGELTRRIELVHEEGWKIDLPATISLNRPPK
jgi:hypothetical protein